MTDLHRLLREGVPDPTPPKDLPSIMPWAIVALVLVLVSLSIHFFWVVPKSSALPDCTTLKGQQQQAACVRQGP